MAFPVILVNSATGSDTAASGAGPGTALSGAATASTDATGLIVTVAATTDLTNVAVDGSHVIYLADATAGKRNFGKITAKAGSGGATPNVTVADAFGINQITKDWAIGGVRAKMSSTASYKLFDNNATAGDAMPGWAIEMQSGHVETIVGDGTNRVVIRRSGDTTSGRIILRGTLAAATMPVLTFPTNGAAFLGATTSDLLTFRDFEVKNSNATKTASVAFDPGASGVSAWQLINIRVRDAANKFWRAVNIQGPMTIRDCEIANCANVGIIFAGGTGATIRNNWIHACTSHGISAPTVDDTGTLIYGNLITGNSGDGMNLNCSATTNARRSLIVQNTIDNNTGSGIDIGNANRSLDALAVLNNILSNNGTYGLKFSNASATQAFLDATGIFVSNNGTFNNTTSAYLPTGYGASDPALNPTFTNTGGNDYSVGTNLKAKGYPIGGALTVGTTSSTNSYVDIGAAQRQEPVGGGAVARIIGG